MVNKNTIKEQLKSAYRKYKADIYFNNYAAIQRKELADFECENFGFTDINNTENLFDEYGEIEKNKIDKVNEKINKNIDNFFDNFAEDLLKNHEKVFNDIYNEIEVILYPKTMNSAEPEEHADKKPKKKEYNDNNKIITNIKQENFDVKQSHYFISLPIKGHILGILWILRRGYVLDDKLYGNCYSNRLNHIVKDKIIKKEKKGETYSENTPFLFEPYFKKYESWRDEGLDKAEKLLENNKDVIIISLDLKDYYYRSNINFEDLKSAIDCGKKRIFGVGKCTEFDNYLDEYIECVFIKYSEKFKRDWVDSDEDKFPMIPLGFAPSLIISNWHLQGFDQKIVEDLTPLYYGRYVDDMMIILPSHKKSDTFGSQHFESHTVNDMICYYLTKYQKGPKISILKQNTEKTCDFSLLNQISKLSHPDDENKDKKLHFHYKNLIIQPNKIKIFTFSHNNSKALLDNFKNEIYLNSSEFRLMPDNNKLYDDFEKDIYSIMYDDSINKLKDINHFKISKFQLSKKLSQLVKDSICKNKNHDEILDKVLYAFKGNILNFMSLWEKIFSFLYINNNIEKFTNFLIYTILTIDNLKFKNNNAFGLKNNEEEYLLKKYLLQYLYSTIVRIISLKYDNNVMSKIKSLFDNPNITEKEFYEDFQNMDISTISQKFIMSSLMNNSLMKYPVMSNIFDFNNSYKKVINFIKPQDRIMGKFYGYYPRYVQFHECLLHELHSLIFSNNHLSDSYIEYAFELYCELNYKNKDCDDLNKNDFFIKSCETQCSLCDFSPDSENKKDKANIGNNVKNSKYNGTILKTRHNKKFNKIKMGVVNTNLNRSTIIQRLINKPNLTLDRLSQIRNIINEAIKKEVDILVMPELFIPYEWIDQIVEVSRKNQIAIIFGLEYIIYENEDLTDTKKSIGNYLFMTMPTKNEYNHYKNIIAARLKNHYAPKELNLFKDYDLEEVKNNPDGKYFLLSWNGIHIVPYCCYEIADIHSRSLFKSCVDLVTVSEYNKDVIYSDNIIESLSRDLFCYCVKVNTSEFGGTSIIKPAKNEEKYFVKLKGGEDDYVVTWNLDIKKLKDAQKKAYSADNSEEGFKPKPPGLNPDILKKR